MGTVPTEALTEALDALGGRVRRDEPLGPRTTYRVGGAAGGLVEVDGIDDLVAVSRAIGPSRVPLLVLGKGSNLLVADAGFPGIVVALSDGLAQVAIEGTSVAAGGAASLPVVARKTAAAGLTGFEWAVGVPGSVGGAVRMNAGGHGSDMASCLTSIHLIDLRTGEQHHDTVDQLGLGYRSSSVSGSTVVVGARLTLAVGDRATAEAEISEIVRWRRANQPGGQNAGSVFVNPEGDSAGRLVEASGCKGLRRGSAAVSDKHANFIQADAGGSADDVRALMDHVAERVASATGVKLRPETRLVGFDDQEERQ